MHVDYLEHHGILGQKWGLRRFQNPDGTLTDAGKNRIRSKYDHAQTAIKTAKKISDSAVESAKRRQRILNAKGLDDDEVVRRYNNLKAEQQSENGEVRRRANEKESMYYRNGGVGGLDFLFYSHEQMVKDGIKKEYATELKDIEKRNIEAGKNYADKLDKLMSINIDDLIAEGDYRKARQTIRDVY